MYLYIHKRCIVLIILSIFTVHLQLTETKAVPQTATRGTEVTLKCENGSSGNVEWRYEDMSRSPSTFQLVFKNGRLLNNQNGRFSEKTDPDNRTHNLIIPNVTFEDAGRYTCDIDSHHYVIELIVFEFCSISVGSHDPVLGSNVYCLQPGVVELSCKMSYRGSGSSPRIEWSRDEKSIESNVSTTNYITESRVQIPASGLQSSTSIECRVKNNSVEHELIWSESMNITHIQDTNFVTEVVCDQNTVTCSTMNDTVCSHVWMDENKSVVSSNMVLDLKGKPNGNYSCVATCSVRKKWCAYVAKIVHLTCNGTQGSESQFLTDTSGDQMSSSRKDLIVICILTAIAAVAIVTASVFLFRRMYRKRNSDQTKISQGAKEILLTNRADTSAIPSPL